MLDVKTCVAISCILGSAGPVLAATVSPIASEAALKTAVSQHVSHRDATTTDPRYGGSRAVAGGKPFITALARPMWPRSARRDTRHSMFELGSISKTYAGVIGVMALERGRY